jgi:hypothetical protein
MRRAALDAREQSMSAALREKMLAAAERQVDAEACSELKQLEREARRPGFPAARTGFRTQIAGLVKKSLSKSMKPEDAARIFNRLGARHPGGRRLAA